MDFPDSKAREILTAYARGERNFRGINLSRVYFANPDVTDFPSYDLSEADFSAGIFRSTFFGYANLQGCNFEGRTTAQDTRLWNFITALIVVLTGLLAKQVFFPSA